MKGFLNRLRSKDGFILIFAMLMILLLMVFMTAIVGAVGYTNRVTLEKSEEHQLQLTAQSAVVTLKDYFADSANMARLMGLIGKTQEYDLSGAGLNDKVRATISESTRPGFVLLTVTAYDENGREYTTSTLLPVTTQQAGINELIQNMIVAYRPSANRGFTSNLTYKDVVMNGSIIVDNEVFDDYTVTQTKYDIDGDGDVDDNDRQIIEYTGYAEDNYDNFTSFPSAGNDQYAVKILGGTFKELVTTGNLYIDVQNGLYGYGHNSDYAGTTIASAMGQLVVKGSGPSSEIGGGSDGYIAEMGAGGYFVDKEETVQMKKTGKMKIENIKFADEVELFTRDGVQAIMSGLYGESGQWNFGAKLTYTHGNGDLEVDGDVLVYNKEADITINSGKMEVNGDVAATSVKLNVNSGATLEVEESVVAAQKSITATGAGNLIAKALMAGSNIQSSVGTTKLSGDHGYSVFSGGNYAYEKGKDYLDFDMSQASGTKVLNLTSDSEKNVVINNKNDSSGLTNHRKNNSADDLQAFKTMNTLWLSKAQKVYKGGWSSNASKVNFAVALLFDSSIKNSNTMGAAGADGGGSTKSVNFVEAAANPAYKNDANDTDQYVYNPEIGSTDSNKTEWNYQWYTSKKGNEKYYTSSGNQPVPLSHELYYTTDDNLLILRDVLQKALGGPSNSENLNVNRSSQGRFVNIARTAIPFDGAVDGATVHYKDGSEETKVISIGYPAYGNNAESGAYLNDLAQAGYVTVESYKDGYLIGTTSSTGRNNFGWIQMRGEGDSLSVYDGATYVHVGSSPLYFRVTSATPEGNFTYGSWGDFYITREDGDEIKLNNDIIIEYELDSLETEDLTRLSYVRWFLDPNKRIIFAGNSSIQGIAYNAGSSFGSPSLVEGTPFTYDAVEYEQGVMPEFYIFCPKPSSFEKTSIEIDTKDFKGFIVAPWSMVDMETAAADNKNEEVFRGIILCKNFITARTGQYNHYKPIAFSGAINAEVFKLPNLEEKG